MKTCDCKYLGLRLEKEFFFLNIFCTQIPFEIHILIAILKNFENLKSGKLSTNLNVGLLPY